MRSFGANPKGYMTLSMGGLMLVAAFIIGGVVDYLSLSNQKQASQSMADRAALAAAQELIVFKGSGKRVTSVAEVFVGVNYTAIIAGKFDMKDGPELVLNTGYENSPIPVPEGVGNKAGPIVKLAAST